MRKIILFTISAFLLSVSYSNAQIRTMSNSTQEKKMPSIYDYTVKDISGKNFAFKSLKGKKIMIVNTASECGYTPQYKELEELYQKHEGDLVIVGFPTNDFGGQEPGTNQEIAKFCTENYGVTFPMMEKITLQGKTMHEVYAFLTQKSMNDVMDSTVKWNFQKYLLDENGRLMKVFDSKVSPNSDEVIAAVKDKSRAKDKGTDKK